MQPSELEIRREVEALRDIRRRSTQGSPLTLDPDLPTIPSSASSPQSGYWSAGNMIPSPSSLVSSSPSEAGTDSASDSPVDDPTHLFWVPAHLHPELAPSEFRAFLKEHARSPPDADAASPSLGRSSSGASSLGRKKSMLSRQYKPAVGDGVENEQQPVPRKKRTSIYRSPAGSELSINDLQKLEELAEEASRSDDPTRLRSVIRRSLSLNVAPSMIDQMDDLPEDVDAPIIAPRPGHGLQRAARTKIRKPNLPGDGGGHRFPSQRRGMRGQPAAPSTSDISSTSDHDEPYQRPQAPTSEMDDDELRRPSFEDRNRPLSFSEETSIYDAYADPRQSFASVSSDTSDDPRALPSLVLRSPPEPEKVPLPPTPVRSTQPASPQSPPKSQPQPQQPQTQPQPTLHHPTPQRHLDVPASGRGPSRTPSPNTPPSSPDPLARSPSASPSQDPNSFSQPAPPPPPRKDKEKEKEKKSLFGKWGGKEDKAASGKGKKGKQEKQTEPQREATKEKESGFFGSLFGKKKQEDSSSMLGVGAGSATAAALLGPSKSKANASPPSPSPHGPYARYPIHVERAVYRLSHIKLANPRRPLYEQVLISNLMFWYLGVINKTQNGPGNNQTQQQQAERERAEREQAERAEREREEREREEREKMERERMERERMERGNRRVSLTKERPPGEGRRAEMPVRGPQYGLQHQRIEHEMGRGGSNPGAQGYHLPHRHPQYSQPHAYQDDGGLDYGAQPKHLVQTQYSGNGLPPGAMSPQTPQYAWSGGAGNPSQGRARSPPRAGAPGLQGRSLSASATTPSQPTSNGRTSKSLGGGRRRRSSDEHGNGAEEDVPLALWQQNQRNAQATRR